MSNKIERLHSVTKSYTATANGATSPRIPFGAAAGGAMVVTALTGSATKITWHVALEPEGTAYPLQSGGSAVETAVAANNAYVLPDGLYGAAFLVPVADADTVTFRLIVKG